MKVYLLYLLLIKEGILTISPYAQFNNEDDCKKMSREIITSISEHVEYIDAKCYAMDVPYGEYSYDGRVY